MAMKFCSDALEKRRTRFAGGRRPLTSERMKLTAARDIVDCVSGISSSTARSLVRSSSNCSCALDVSELRVLYWVPVQVISVSVLAEYARNQFTMLASSDIENWLHLLF